MADATGTQANSDSGRRLSAGSEVVVERQTVVVAIDGSDQAEYAFEYYYANLFDDSHDLLLVHVADPPVMPIGRNVDKSEFDKEIEAEQRKVKVLQDKFGANMMKKQMKGRMVAVFSNQPGETLCKLARRENATLIVMGTRGLGAIRRTILGSVSNYVLHHAHCPVCICRPV